MMDVEEEEEDSDVQGLAEAALEVADLGLASAAEVEDSVVEEVALEAAVEEAMVEALALEAAVEAFVEVLALEVEIAIATEEEAVAAEADASIETSIIEPNSLPKTKYY